MASEQLKQMTRNGYDAAVPRRSDAAPFERVEFCHGKFLLSTHGAAATAT